MFGEKYVEEEVRKKVNSMKQLDRIEFISKTHFHSSGFANIYLSIILIYTFSIILLLAGFNFVMRSKLLFMIDINNIASGYLIVGFFCLLFSFLSMIGGLIIAKKVSKKEKESKENLEKFLEEKSK